MRGSDARPRLSVYRSNTHIYAQVISDESGKTLAAASTLEPQLRGQIQRPGTIEGAKAVGTLVAQRCLERGIRRVVFDRNGFLYHGQVRAVAESAREAGLEF